MPLVQVDMKTLADIDDGRVAKAFEHELRRLAMDCDDRPGDKNPRKLVLEMKLVPIPHSDGGTVTCDGVNASFKIKSSVPERKTKTYELKANRKGQLIFSSNSPENFDQTTIDDVNPKTGRIER